jgi:hypothetical protein
LESDGPDDLLNECIFARFCKFQKLVDKIKAKEYLKEGSKGADVNEGK